MSGDILELPKPRSSWIKYFGDRLSVVRGTHMFRSNLLTPAYQETPLTPIVTTNETLSDIGKNPSKKAVVVALPTIESSFTNHISKGIQGFKHPEFPALRVALEVLNASEGYLWVIEHGSGCSKQY